jgi:hypothetical protein
MSIIGLDSMNLVSGGTTSFGSAGAVTINFEDVLTTTITGAVSETYSAGQTTAITGDQTTTTTGVINLN